MIDQPRRPVYTGQRRRSRIRQRWPPSSTNLLLDLSAGLGKRRPPPSAVVSSIGARSPPTSTCAVRAAGAHTSNARAVSRPSRNGLTPTSRSGPRASSRFQSGPVPESQLRRWRAVHVMMVTRNCGADLKARDAYSAMINFWLEAFASTPDGARRNVERAAVPQSRVIDRLKYSGSRAVQSCGWTTPARIEWLALPEEDIAHKPRRRFSAHAPEQVREAVRTAAASLEAIRAAPQRVRPGRRLAVWQVCRSLLRGVPSAAGFVFCDGVDRQRVVMCPSMSQSSRRAC